MKRKLKQAVALVLTCVLVVSAFGTSLSAFSADTGDFNPGFTDDYKITYDGSSSYQLSFNTRFYDCDGNSVYFVCPLCGYENVSYYPDSSEMGALMGIWSTNGDYGLHTGFPESFGVRCQECNQLVNADSFLGTGKIAEINYNCGWQTNVSTGVTTRRDDVWYDVVAVFTDYYGNTVYFYPFRQSYDSGMGEDPNGHIYGYPTFNWDGYDSCTADFECIECGHIEIVDCDITSEVTIEPTEATDGERTYTATCEFNEVTYTDTKTEIIPTTSEPTHEHEYGEPTFDWVDDYSSCTAIFECVDGDDTQIVECKVTSSTDSADCENDGSITYYAECEFEGESYSDTQVVVIPALGHTYGEPEFDWSEFNLETGEGAVTATFTCTCGHEETVVCEVESDEDGDDIVYTATAEFEGATYTDTMTYEGEEPVAEEPDDTDEPESSTGATVPAGGSSSTGTTGGTSGNTGSTSGTVSPQTSDIISIAAVVALALASGSVGVLTLYRRKHVGNAQ